LTLPGVLTVIGLFSPNGKRADNTSMNVGDTVSIKGIPTDVKDDEHLKTRTLFEKCVGREFVIAGIEQPEGFPSRFVRLDVGHVVGEEPFRHTIWVEEEYVQLRGR
jgi:hypothetical protein